jgi:hypothetical protein
MVRVAEYLKEGLPCRPISVQISSIFPRFHRGRGPAVAEMATKLPDNRSFR